jgi:tetratricopeptide (TPR) repeat protein
LLRSLTLTTDPALESRLEQSVADDPLKLANARTRDHWEGLWARTFNAVSEPIGKSLIWGLAIAPLNLTTSLLSYAVGMYERPAMSLQERQALAHWKRFVAQYPDSVDTQEIEKKIAKAQKKLDKMLGTKFESAASKSLDQGRYRSAAHQAERAIDIDPEDEDAIELYAEAQSDRMYAEDLRRISEQFELAPPTEIQLADVESPDAPVEVASTARMLELLLVSNSAYQQLDVFSEASFDDPSSNQRAMAQLEELSARARMLIHNDPDGPLADEAEYVLSLSQRDLGYEEDSWERLRRLARLDPQDSNMARHAKALLYDPWQNTYGNYLRQRHRASDKAVMTRLFGRFAGGPPNRVLPLPLAWLISAPSIAQTLVTAPLRLVFGDWNPAGVDLEKTAAVAGYRHLGRNPYGRHSREVADWLFDYETGRENWSGALQIVDLQGDVDETERVVLMEKAARKRLAAAALAVRRDWRSALLRGIVRKYPDTNAGYQAGEQLRQLVDDASPQRIRMTRSFLKENPEIASVQGLAMNPDLLDKDLSNGEVHPEGVTFLGGRVMEFALVGASGDEDDPPYTRREQISTERLARTVAMLDETVTRNDQLDDGVAVYPDAYRDQYFERARLGLSEQPDLRASAQSNYVYESLREQYGIVRGRDSILPFDLVFQGSLGDMSLGAFPRWRQPKETPDAFLYR